MTEYPNRLKSNECNKKASHPVRGFALIVLTGCSSSFKTTLCSRDEYPKWTSVWNTNDYEIVNLFGARGIFILMNQNMVSEPW